MNRQRYRLRAPSTGREVILEGEPGRSYVDRETGEPLEAVGKLAQDMGGFGIRVHHPGELQSALDKAVASGKPAVVDVVSDINGIAPRAWTPS